MTRPNDAVVPLSKMDELKNILTIEHDNPPLLVSILAKLSRKFSEKSVYTQLKAAIVLHSMMQVLPDAAAQIAWSKAIDSMREEMDGKTGNSFFSLDLIEDAVSYANTAMELETSGLARLYIPYIFDIITLRQPIKPINSHAKKSSTGIQRAKKLLTAFTANAEIIQFFQEDHPCLHNALPQQCKEQVVVDRDWILQELKKLYEDDVLMEEREVEEMIMELLKKHRIPYNTAMKQPMIENNIPTALPTLPQSSSPSSSVSATSYECDGNACKIVHNRNKNTEKKHSDMKKQVESEIDDDDSNDDGNEDDEDDEMEEEEEVPMKPSKARSSSSSLSSTSKKTANTASVIRANTVVVEEDTRKEKALKAQKKAQKLRDALRDSIAKGLDKTMLMSKSSTSSIASSTPGKKKPSKRKE